MLTPTSPAASSTDPDRFDPDHPVAWVTGAAGLIGRQLVKSAGQGNLPWRIRPLARADLDLADLDAVERRFRRESPKLVVHCAALSSSVDCERDPLLAHQLNCEVTAHLAGLAGSIPFFFFSTDLVFDGRQGSYRESDPPNPLSVYGETKAIAEQVVLANARHTVIRTSLNAGFSPAGNRAFNEQLAHAWRSGKSTRLFTDEFRSPIEVEATAGAVWELAAQGAVGLWHVAGSERLSRWEIGRIVATAFPDLPALMEPGSIADYAGPPRPADTSLDCSRAGVCLSFPLPGFSTWKPQR